jgi:hypothetical protein
VFGLKLKDFLRVIVKEDFFGDMAAFVFTIEFQKRGLPHAHILLTLDNKTSPTNTVPAIDSIVCA